MATLSFVLTVTGPVSTAVTLTPAAPVSGSGGAFTVVSPVAAGLTVGTFSVAPAGWQGALALTGADADKFTLSGSALITAVALPVGSYSLTATATP